MRWVSYFGEYLGLITIREVSQRKSMVISGAFNSVENVTL